MGSSLQTSVSIVVKEYFVLYLLFNTYFINYIQCFCHDLNGPLSGFTRNGYICLNEDCKTEHLFREQYIEIFRNICGNSIAVSNLYLFLPVFI